MSRDKVEVKHRREPYAERYATSIWKELPAEHNPFVEEDVLCRGYPMQALVGQLSYADYLYLLIKGELPAPEQGEFLNRLLIAFSSPGPRHEASRAAVLAGVGKTLSQHVLPVALLVYGGERTGAAVVEKAMRYLRKQQRKPADDADAEQLQAAGFGAYYGDTDCWAQSLATLLASSSMATPCLDWADAALASLATDAAIGWTKPTVAAAAFCDLGIMPRHGVALLQMMAAPGLMVQGLEHGNKPATVLPFVADDQYQFREQAAPCKDRELIDVES